MHFKFIKRLFAVDLFQAEHSLFLKDNEIDGLRADLKAQKSEISSLRKELRTERDRYARDIGAINDRLLQLNGLAAKPAPPKEPDQKLKQGDGFDEAAENILWQRAQELCEQKISDRPITQSDLELEYNLMRPNWREWVSN